MSATASSIHANDQPFTVTVDALRALLPAHLRAPRVGIVCGSGLSTLAASMRDVHEVPYESLPGFGASTGAFAALFCLRSHYADGFVLTSLHPYT